MWEVPKIWDKGDVFILGGGSSLTKQFDIPEEIVQSVRNKQSSLSVYSPYLKALHNKHVIAINVLFLVGNWVDMLFFGDNKFYRAYRRQITAFPGMKLTCNTNFANNVFEKEKIKYVAKNRKQHYGISDDSKMVSWNKNSGAAAISVAANAGAKRIILLGFDMKLDEKGNQHCHTEYQNVKHMKPVQRKSLPFNRHLKGFGKIHRDAKERGIEILNANQESAITVFPKINIKEVL